MAKKPQTTRDEIDIKAKLDGKIEAVIKRLQALAKKYPGATVEVYNDWQYGESYAAARLEFVRAKTAVEIERDDWEVKAERLAALRSEARAFTNNKLPYPRAEEIEALRKELGFFAMAPRDGSLVIFNGEVLVQDMMRGARRRDGTFVLRMMMGGSPEMDAIYEKMDAEYRDAT